MQADGFELARRMFYVTFVAVCIVAALAINLFTGGF